MKLLEQYDVILFDLDGVIYRGPEAVPGAAETLAEIRQAGRRVGFVTNNASRTPEQVATHLRDLGIEAQASDVVTSAQAVAALMATTLPEGSAVFVLGAPALAQELEGVGLAPTSSLDDSPVALVQGYDPQMTWPRIQDGVALLHRGVEWFASNSDATIPSDRGIMPGLGSVITLLAGVVGRQPKVAGKPETPLLEETMKRLGEGRYLFVGDRLDTDIAGAHRVHMDSLFVQSGVHTMEDLRGAPAEQQPTFVGDDVTALCAPPCAFEGSGADATPGTSQP